MLHYIMKPQKALLDLRDAREWVEGLHKEIVEGLVSCVGLKLPASRQKLNKSHYGS